jgi:ABC-type Mn2+/Zn2+ transport system permease subunit
MVYVVQLRTVSLWVAVAFSIIALVSGAILFFVIEPPFLASIFLASGAIAIACFLIAGLAAYLEP